MRTLILAAATLAAVGSAHAQTVVVRPQGETVVTEPPPAVVEERGVVVERKLDPYRQELNSDARENTPNVGDGTSRSNHANQN